MQWPEEKNNKALHRKQRLKQTKTI